MNIKLIIDGIEYNCTPSATAPATPATPTPTIPTPQPPVVTPTPTPIPSGVRVNNEFQPFFDTSIAFFITLGPREKAAIKFIPDGRDGSLFITKKSGATVSGCSKVPGDMNRVSTFSKDDTGVMYWNIENLTDKNNSLQLKRM